MSGLPERWTEKRDPAAVSPDIAGMRPWRRGSPFARERGKRYTFA